MLKVVKYVDKQVAWIVISPLAKVTIDGKDGGGTFLTAYCPAAPEDQAGRKALVLLTGLLLCLPLGRGDVTADSWSV